MRNAFFWIIIASCFLLVHTAIIPVSALPGGSQEQSVSPAAVTISASPSNNGTYVFGDAITFTGSNTGSAKTYLFLSGPGLNAAGSQIERDNPRLWPVVDDAPSTFTAVRVGADKRWSWTWDTHKSPLNAGTYTIYAVSSPRDKSHLDSAIHDSVAINLTEPALSAAVRPSDATQGDTITISGKATGHPAPGVAIWIIGPDYSNRYVVETDPAGFYSLDIDSRTTHLFQGNYHVVAEHPGDDGEFDFNLNGDYFYNNRIRANIFTFQGNGRFYGEAAYTAFTSATSGQNGDDLIKTVSFSMQAPHTAASTTVSASPSANATYSPEIGIARSGNDAAPGNVSGPASAGSVQTQRPVETVSVPPGNSSGNGSLPAGNNGDSLPYGSFAVVFCIVLIAGVGGAVYFTRKMRAAAALEKSPGNTMPFPQSGRTDDHRAGAGSPATATSLPTGMASGVPVSQAVSMNAFPEELADKYTQITPIGSGGFARVYSACRIRDNQQVAVKIPIRSNERTGRSFLHEIKVWETMHHPNIVGVKAANILPVPYVEMEFVPGSLDTLAKPVPVVTAARITRGIAEGIRYAHVRRCIHRDIKPQNILLTDEMVPKITDWGISKVLEENRKKTTIAGFSLSSAAPEQIAPESFGSTDERTDIYQIGAVFYELVTGSVPFENESMMETVNSILYDDPFFPPGINPDAAVKRIILKCLAKEKQQRYQSADELLEALNDYLDTRDRDIPGDDS